MNSSRGREVKLPARWRADSEIMGAGEFMTPCLKDLA
jgi:hypothetical protein